MNISKFWMKKTHLHSYLRPKKYPLVNKHSHGKWPFIVDFPIENGDFLKLFWHNQRVKQLGVFCPLALLLALAIGWVAQCHFRAVPAIFVRVGIWTSSWRWNPGGAAWYRPNLGVMIGLGRGDLACNISIDWFKGQIRGKSHDLHGKIGKVSG